MADGTILELEPCKAEPISTADSDAGRMRVSVIFTTIAGTAAALETAAKFARQLNAEVVLVVAEEIYFRYALESPPVSANFFEKLCLALLEELQLDSHATRIEILFCRDQVQCLQNVLAPRSLVLIGKRKRWLNFRERKIERGLSRQGHEVIVITSNSRLSGSLAESVTRRLLVEAKAPSSL